jgi:acetyl-CoA carboxylase carboxyltransferase component
MYQDWGGLPAAGVISGIGTVSGRTCMIIANDATIKAGAMFPQSTKKILRMQRIAYECKMPIIYLVDSSGVFLPLQDEIFPDEDDFGRIFRNNAVLSAAGIPQIAAIMGNCIAGGGYLPVLCDKLVMTEGSGLYLAGPSLVKAAINQEVNPEDLGGAEMHSSISGTVDFKEPNDEACLQRVRSLIDMYPHETSIQENFSSAIDSAEIYDIVGIEKEYNVHELIKCIVDQNSFQEFKAEYGKTLVTGYAKINGQPVGIVANQKIQTTTGKGQVEIGGVIYSDGADKAARFVLDCNQTRVPIIFLQDVTGFMVGKEAEQSGIIRSGAKLVNAVSNSIVPKITFIIGNSFGAGHYALCGKAYDPEFIFAWPAAKYAVMGGNQAADTLFSIQQKAAKRKESDWDEDEAMKLKQKIKEQYDTSMDIRYGAARGWVDAIIDPQQTRSILVHLLPLVMRKPMAHSFHTGVIQV